MRKIVKPEKNVVEHPNGDVQINGRFLNVDGEVSIHGERGRFRYTGFSRASDGKLVLHFVGGAVGHEKMRAFHPDKVKTVHNVRTKGRQWIFSSKTSKK